MHGGVGKGKLSKQEIEGGEVENCGLLGEQDGNLGLLRDLDAGLDDLVDAELGVDGGDFDHSTDDDAHGRAPVVVLDNEEVASAGGLADAGEFTAEHPVADTTDQAIILDGDGRAVGRGTDLQRGDAHGAVGVGDEADGGGEIIDGDDAPNEGFFRQDDAAFVDAAGSAAVDGAGFRRDAGAAGNHLRDQEVIAMDDGDGETAFQFGKLAGVQRDQAAEPEVLIGEFADSGFGFGAGGGGHIAVGAGRCGHEVELGLEPGEGAGDGSEEGGGGVGEPVLFAQVARGVIGRGMGAAGADEGPDQNDGQERPEPAAGCHVGGAHGGN